MAEATFTSFTAQIEPVVTPRPAAVPVSAQPFAAASAGNTATSVTYRLVTSVEAIRALEPEWTALYRRSARPAQAFQQFHRLSAWLTAFADTRGADQPIVAIGHRNGHAVVIAPLAISRRQGLRVLTWMGEPAVQYGSILVDQVSDAVDLCSDVIDFAISETRPDLAHLRRVRTDFGLNASLAAEGFSVIERDAAPYLDFADKLTAEDYETRYPNKARKNRRRLLRRLEEQHTVEFIRLKPGSDAARSTLAALAMKRAWLNNRAEVSPALYDDRMARWFEAIATDPACDCRITEMRCDGELAAAQIGFRDGDRLSLYLIVFGLKFEKDGVGALHLEHTIREAFEEGIRTIDLLAPNMEYKRKWADETAELADFVRPCTTLGRIYTSAYLMNGRKLAKRALRSLPQSVRNTVNRFLRR